MDSPSSYTFLKVFAALLFVAINAFFVAAEFSIVKIRRSRLEEIESHGSKKAKLAIKITSFCKYKVNDWYYLKARAFLQKQGTTS